MVKFVPNRHLKRMFPYMFFNELYGHLTDYTPENAVFLLRGTPHESKLDDNLEKQFEEIRKELLGDKTLEQNNIYELDQGEFLIVDTYIKRSDIPQAIQQSESVPRYILLAQLFDSAEQPVFSKNTSLETIRKIPEVLWDDPNLALLLLPITADTKEGDLNEAIELLVIKGPDHFINSLLSDENVERTDD